MQTDNTISTYDLLWIVLLNSLKWEISLLVLTGQKVVQISGLNLVLPDNNNYLLLNSASQW